MEIFLVLIITLIIGGGIFLIAQMYKVKQQEKRLLWLSSQRYSVLRVDVPKNNDKPPLSAEQMFASIHGVYADNAMFQPEMSFEIVAKEKYIQFFIRIPEHIRDFVEGQIYAQYPSVEIHQIDDYATDSLVSGAHFAVTELEMTKPDVYPIKLFSDFEVDPISGITAVMTKLESDEQLCLQLIARPIGDEWQDKGTAMVESVRGGKSGGGKGVLKSLSKGSLKLFKMLLLQAIRPGEEMVEAEAPKKELSSNVEDALKQIEMKILKLGYQTKIRILAVSKDPNTAKVRAQNLSAAYKQYNTTNLNGFKTGNISVDNRASLAEYFNRSFEDGGNILNIGELASLFHFPHESVSTPNIVWSGAKKGEPPANLPLLENTPPEELTIVGETNFRNAYIKFGIKQDDRRRHIYVIGKSGVGKSVYLENMAIDDVWKDKGVIVVDPHGEFAEKILSCVPDHRIEDVVVFDPADRGFPVAFNLLENVDDDFKGMVASGFVGIFKKIFGNSWGPRLEHILRNTVLALLDYPNSTMLDIPKMLTETRFREKVVEFITDPVIKDFWQLEFAQYDSKFRTEAVSPILNKVGQFLATATIRNIVGQPQSTINIREIMDSRKIMVVNLSRGKIGEDNSALLGAMMITKIQLAAMSRADVTVDQRPDCHLYVDEFQNFATDSFAVILSEARKYHLNLTIANQYIAQLPEEVRDAVFGNAGTLVSFRVGGADADFLVKEYAPVFEENDLVNLDKYNIYIKLLVDGVASPAFSARTLPPVESLTGNTEKIIDHSRKKYSNERAYVEQMIMNRSKAEQLELMAEAEAYKSGGLEALLVKKKVEPTSSDSQSSIRSIPGYEEYRPSVASANKIASEAKPALEAAEPEAEPAPIAPAQVQKAADAVADSSVATQAEKGASKDAQESSGGEPEEKKEKKTRFLRYQNIIGDKVYKEQTARGGIKWYIGEDIDRTKFEEAGIIIDENGERMIELAKLADEKLDKEDPKHSKNKVILSEKTDVRGGRAADDDTDEPGAGSLPHSPQEKDGNSKNSNAAKDKGEEDNEHENDASSSGGGLETILPASSDTHDKQKQNNNNPSSEDSATAISEGESVQL